MIDKKEKSIIKRPSKDGSIMNALGRGVFKLKPRPKREYQHVEPTNRRHLIHRTLDTGGGDVGEMQKQGGF